MPDTDISLELHNLESHRTSLMNNQSQLLSSARRIVHDLNNKVTVLQAYIEVTQINQNSNVQNTIDIAPPILIETRQIANRLKRIQLRLAQCE